MRFVAKLTGVLALPLIGVIIGGLIVGNSATWGWGLALFAVDCIVGMVAQYIADQRDMRFARELMEIAEEVYAEQGEGEESKEEYEIEDENDGDEELEFEEECGLEKEDLGEDLTALRKREMQRIIDIMKKNGSVDEAQRMKNNGMLERFHSHYERLSALPESGRAICYVEDDPSAELLFEVCASMPYAPRRHDFFEAIAVLAVEIEGAPAIWYALKPRGGGIQYASVFLVRSKSDKIRLFSVEPSAHTLFLCEFADGRHINYGDVRPADFRDRIGEILKNGEK